jgi:hypothetical protein
MARAWINLFTSLRRTSINSGYKRAAVTPYMHSFVYHVPRFMQLYQSVKVFTGQGVEKIMMWQGVWFYANPIRRTLHQMFFN